MDWLFLGSVMHDRRRPRRNRFRYPVYFLHFPLSRLAELDNGLCRVNRPGLISFQERDHGPRDGRPLLPWIHERLAEAGVHGADGEVWLQTFPRVLGYVFNPVSFWYCEDREGRLRAVLAEVNNTFGGRHCYLLRHPDGHPIASGDRLSAEKAFHVSPFCQLQGHYRFRFSRRGDGLTVAIDYHDDDGLLLATAIAGRGRRYDRRGLLTAFLGHPWLSAGVIARIHYQALKLWLKGVPFHGRRPPARPIEESPR